jgi:chromosome segregation ATPase
LANRLEELQAQVSKLQDALGKLLQQQRDLDADITAKSSRQAELSTEVANQEATLREARTAWEQAAKSLADVNNKLSAAEGQLDAPQKQVGKLQEQQRALDADILTKTSRLAELSKQVATQQAKLQDAQTAWEQAEKSLADVRGKLSAAGASDAALKDSIVERKTAEEALADVQERLRQAKAGLKLEQDKLTDSQGELADLQQAAGATRAARQEQDRLRTELADRITKLEQQINVLTEQCKKLLAADAALEQCRALVQDAAPIDVDAVTPPPPTAVNGATSAPSSNLPSARNQ